MDILLIVYMISTVGLVITVIYNKGLWELFNIKGVGDIFTLVTIVVTSPILFAWAIYEYYIKKGK